MRARIRKRFELNIQRVRHLIAVYAEVSKSKTSPLVTYKKDVLRAAVVLLHASLEDLIRGLVAYKLPVADPEAFADIAFNAAKGGKFEISLVELARLRGRTIDEVLQIAIDSHLERRTYNNVAEIRSALQAIGVKVENFRKRIGRVAPVMTRRHQIVHRSDRKDLGANDHGKPHDIARSDVESWLVAVEALGSALLKTVK